MDPAISPTVSPVAERTAASASVEIPPDGFPAPTPPAGNPDPAGNPVTDAKKEKQRLRWRDQKKNQRLRKLAEMGGNLPGALPPRVAPVESAAGAEVPAAGVSAADDPLPAVSWSEAELAEIVGELIETLEEWDKTDDVKKARALQIGGELLKQIEADAGIPRFCKTVWKKFLPRLAKKWLSKANISGEYDAEAAIALSALYYLWDKSKRGREIKAAAKALPVQP
jgi:hypothetical protein